MRILKNQRGSALVLVTLLTLILAALAIVALRNVARSTQQAGVFATRHQAQMASGATANVVSRRVGDKAANVYARMEAKVQGEDEAEGERGLIGGEFLGSGAMGSRLDAIRRGPYTVFAGEDFEAFLPTYGGNSRLMGTSTAPSFEDQRPSSFRAIVRDPVDAQPSEGFSENWCFKKVQIASESTVGEQDDDWVGANRFGRSRKGIDALIGPIECGY